MEIVSSLVSLTVAKVLRFSGLDRNVLKMEEKALEVYGKGLVTCPGGSARAAVSWWSIISSSHNFVSVNGGRNFR